MIKRKWPLIERPKKLCPKCESEKLSFQEEKIFKHDEWVYIPCHCPDCGFKGTQVYAYDCFMDAEGNIA